MRVQPPRVATAVLTLAAVAWATLTFFLLTSVNPPTPPAPPGSGIWSLPSWVIPTAGHFALFGVLASILTAIAFEARPPTRYLIASTIVVVVLNAAYGAALELYQSTVPNRDPSWMDGAVNTVGAACGAAAMAMVARRLGWVTARSAP